MPEQLRVFFKNVASTPTPLQENALEGLVDISANTSMDDKQHNEALRLALKEAPLDVQKLFGKIDEL